MKSSIRTFLIIMFSLVTLGKAQAVTINTVLSNVVDDTWQYDYSITSATALAPGTGFSIYFNAGEATNLVALAAPVGWDIMVIQPGNVLGELPGWYDALSLNGLGANETAGLFSVQFDWLLLDDPEPEQVFDTYTLDLALYLQNPFSLDIENIVPQPSGTTSVVPLPAAAWLFGSALLGLLMVARRKIRSAI